MENNQEAQFYGGAVPSLLEVGNRIKNLDKHQLGSGYLTFGTATLES
jgi:hypothetical protein